MPKVAQKKSRKPAAKKKPARRVARRQNVGVLESVGARLDSTAPVIAAGALQFGFLALVAAGLLAFLATAFSGQLQSVPERLAALPEQGARTLGLNVMRVTIKGGESLSEREVMNALRDDKHGSVIGRPLMMLDADAMRAAVEKLGPVEAAAVVKLLPDTVHISVIERRPKALYQNDDGEFFVIDGEGVIIRPSSPTEYTELPVVSGTLNPAEATAFIRQLREHPVLFARTAGIVVIGGRRFDLRFRNGFLAKLPEENVTGALKRLESLDAGTGSLAENLDYIDLRDPKWAYYKPKEN